MKWGKEVWYSKNFVAIWVAFDDVVIFWWWWWGCDVKYSPSFTLCPQCGANLLVCAKDQLGSNNCCSTLILTRSKTSKIRDER